MRMPELRAAGLVMGVVLLGWLTLGARGGEKPASEAVDEPVAAAMRAVEPKPLADFTERGLQYLVSQQHENGGWGQGGGWRTGGQNGGRREGAGVNDPTDLGNTCIATLALVRAGSTPHSGPYARQVAKAAEYISRQVRQSDDKSMYVTDVRDTQLQQKIGRYVDTFLAGLVLSELKGQMPDATREQQLLAALEKTVRKIEHNQQQDGTFAGNHGWASVLSQSLCSKFLNRAAQQQVAVKADVLERDFRQSVAALEGRSGDADAFMTAKGRTLVRGVDGTAVRAERGDAGIELYSYACNAGRITAFTDQKRQAEQAARLVLTSKSASTAEKDRARREIAETRQAEGQQRAAAGAVIEKIQDQRFVAGFGNNGGEEFLSYMNISEMLVLQGGAEWEQWDKSVSKKLAQVQNADGSWSGHHCITGRTFCTATALLTLMADRASNQFAAQLARNSK